MFGDWLVYTKNSSESSQSLRGVEVPIIRQTECANAYRKQGGVTACMICAGLKEVKKDGEFSVFNFSIRLNIHDE